MKAHDAVSVSVLVAVDAATAFRAFTEDVDAWWGRGPRFRSCPGAGSVMRFEPGVGGRLVEVWDKEAGEGFAFGRVLAWDPPRRLLLAWRVPGFAPDQQTEVEVRFEEVGDGTRVTVEHRGWDGIPKGHPVRHGLEGEAFLATMGRWWRDLLVTLRRRAGRGTGA